MAHFSHGKLMPDGRKPGKPRQPGLVDKESGLSQLPDQRHFGLSMIFSENRFPLFGIMLQRFTPR
jgi:hypothetical protein